jgi:hypothetical protein
MNFELLSLSLLLSQHCSLLSLSDYPIVYVVGSSRDESDVCSSSPDMSDGS